MTNTFLSGRRPWDPHIENREVASIGIAILTALESVTGTAIGFEAASFVGYISIGEMIVGALS